MTAQEAQEQQPPAQQQEPKQEPKQPTQTKQFPVGVPKDALVYEPVDLFGDGFPRWLRTVIEDAWSFTLIHYNIWAVPVAVLFYYMYQWGYGLVVVALVALYLPSFLDGSQKTGMGRAWESFRQSRIWHISSSYLKCVHDCVRRCGKWW